MLYGYMKTHPLHSVPLKIRAYRGSQIPMTLIHAQVPLAAEDVEMPRSAPPPLIGSNSPATLRTIAGCSGSRTQVSRHACRPPLKPSKAPCEKQQQQQQQQQQAGVEFMVKLMNLPKSSTLSPRLEAAFKVHYILDISATQATLYSVYTSPYWGAAFQPVLETPVLDRSREASRTDMEALRSTHVFARYSSRGVACCNRTRQISSTFSEISSLQLKHQAFTLSFLTKKKEAQHLKPSRQLAFDQSMSIVLRTWTSKRTSEENSPDPGPMSEVGGFHMADSLEMSRLATGHLDITE